MSLPVVPDPDDKHEMHIILQLAGAFARASEHTFVMLLALLVLYVLARFFWAVCVYLFHLYKERAFTPGPHQHLYRMLLIIGAGMFAVALVPFANPFTEHLGWIFLQYAFALFALASVALDWWTKRKFPPPPPVPVGKLTAEQIINYTKTVNAGRAQRLLP